MATKVIGPIVQKGEGPMKDNTKNDPTGWKEGLKPDNDRVQMNVRVVKTDKS